MLSFWVQANQEVRDVAVPGIDCLSCRLVVLGLWFLRQFRNVVEISQVLLVKVEESQPCTNERISEVGVADLNNR